MSPENQQVVDQLLEELAIASAKDAEAAEHLRQAKIDALKRHNVVTSIQRKIKQRGAMPPWANSFFISEIYDLARLRTRLTGVAWEVDHIVPLRNPLVCGLHVEHNLRAIPKMQNKTKGNRYWPDMPEAA